MKILIGLILLLSVYTSAYAQADKRLNERLDSVLRATEKLDFNTVMNFTYPKIFTLVPKEQMVEVMMQSFNSEDFSVSLDSVRIEKIHPQFKIRDASYIVITHSMRMNMKFNETIDTADKDAFDVLLGALQQGFGENNVSFSAADNSFRVKNLSNLLAIKDQYCSEWSFMNIEKEANAFTDKILSKELQNKLKEYETQ